MFFHINTKDTSYILSVLESGQLSCLYYGKRLIEREDYSALLEHHDVPYGDMVSYSKDFPVLGLDDMALEASSQGHGDFREPSIIIRYNDGSTTSDFAYDSYSELGNKPHIQGLPSAYDDDGSSKTYLFELVDKITNIRLKLYYTAFYNSNIITRRMEVVNQGEASVTLERAMSMQLDLFAADFDLITFNGAWACERQKNEKPLSPGIFINDSKQGASSSRSNPFIMLKRRGANEFSGEAYGFNLIYSGNHSEIVEVTHFGKTRVLSGINPQLFSWALAPNDKFCTPEAVLTFSSDGLNGVSQNMHSFIKRNIVRGEWKTKPRPVLVNNWEGTNMDFNERKLIEIAKIGKELGAELFVMDDGWFGARDDDTSSLGDWFVNKKKLPGGLDGLQKKLSALELSFGIWVEPEMVSLNSELYRAHPDWAVKIPGRQPAEGRNQLVLDLTRSEVCAYILEKMSEVFSSADISYVKWDNNRNFSDFYSLGLSADRQGEFFHRYMLGLYEILEKLNERFPHILFESCASGGNRFDLGMLCYMPQIWTSDNTDPISRLYIQCGTSYGYPQSVMGAHVSAAPHQSTLRSTPVETRFNISAFGLLGYEMDLTDITPFDKRCMKAQVEYYKQHRMLLQYGDFIRLRTPFESNRPLFMIISEDKNEAVAGFFQINAEPVHTQDILRLRGLDDKLIYRVTGRKQYISIKTFGSLVKHVMPIKLSGDGMPLALIAKRYMFAMTDEDYRIGGDMLNYAGVKLKQQFGSTGYTQDIRVLGDFGSRLYHIKAE